MIHPVFPASADSVLDMTCREMHRDIDKLMESGGRGREGVRGGGREESEGKEWERGKHTAVLITRFVHDLVCTWPVWYIARCVRGPFGTWPVWYIARCVRGPFGT